MQRRRFELVSRPVDTVDYAPPVIGDVDQVTEAVSTRLVQDGQQPEPARRMAWQYLEQAWQSQQPVSLTVNGREYQLIAYHPRTYAVVDTQATRDPADPPTLVDKTVWLARTSASGWDTWVFIPATGRFHLHSLLFDAVYGIESTMELVPVPIELFHALIRWGATGRTPSPRVLSRLQPSARADLFIPELLVDGRLPAESPDDFDATAALPGRCRTCGDVELTATDVRLLQFSDDRESQCLITCPQCRHGDVSL